MLEMSQAQWEAWEKQVICDFIDRAIDGWHQYFPQPQKQFGHALSAEELRLVAREVVWLCDRRQVDDAVTVTELIFLAWKSAALGLQKACIQDCLSYTVYECSATEFGRRWWGLHLTRLEKALHGSPSAAEKPRAQET